MLSERAITALSDLKREMLELPEESQTEVKLEGRWTERERKPQPMNHAKKKSEGFQTMCRRREW